MKNAVSQPALEVKHYHWFWGWDDEKIADWLMRQLRDGWRLVKVSRPGVFSFIQTGIGDYRYRLGWKAAPGQERLPTRRDIEQDGWEYLGQAQGWMYFRRRMTDGELPDVFCDSLSLLEKYRRQRDLLAMTIPVCLLWLPILTRNIALGLAVSLVAIDAVVIGYLIFSFINIRRRIRVLNRN